MEIKIGIQFSPREIVVEVDKTSDQVTKLVTDAVTKGGAFSLEDTRGRRVLVPADKLSYVEIGEPEQRRVGFGSA